MQPEEVGRMIREVLIQITADFRRVSYDQLACPLPSGTTVKGPPEVRFIFNQVVAGRNAIIHLDKDTNPFELAMKLDGMFIVPLDRGHRRPVRTQKQYRAPLPWLRVVVNEG